MRRQHKHIYSLYIGSLCNVAFSKDHSQKLFMYSLTPAGQDNENEAKLGS